MTLFKCFKRENGNTSRYTCTQCSWCCEAPPPNFNFASIVLYSVWGQTAKFKDSQISAYMVYVTKLLGQLYSYNNTTKESDYICKILTWLKQQWQWRRTWCVDETSSVYSCDLFLKRTKLCVVRLKPVATLCLCHQFWPIPRNIETSHPL